MTDATDRRRSYRLVMLILAAALIAAVVTAAVVGAAGLSMGEALRALFALFGSGADAQGDFPEWAPRLLWSLRLPRIVLALVAGAALSTAGASFQGVFRNPLAEPYLLGVSAGAALGATIAIVWKPLGSGIYGIPVLAFVGGALDGLPRLPRGHLLRPDGKRLVAAFRRGRRLHPHGHHLFHDGGHGARPAHGHRLADGRVDHGHVDEGLHHPAGGRRRLRLHDVHVAAHEPPPHGRGTGPRVGRRQPAHAPQPHDRGFAHHRGSRGLHGADRLRGADGAAHHAPAGRSRPQTPPSRPRPSSAPSSSCSPTPSRAPSLRRPRYRWGSSPRPSGARSSCICSACARGREVATTRVRSRRPGRSADR